MTRLIQKAGVKCHTEKREKRDGWVNRLVSFLSGISKEVLSIDGTSFLMLILSRLHPLDSCCSHRFAACAAST